MAHSPEIKARALEWRAAGQTFEAIAAELSVGIGTIYSKRHWRIRREE
jgi:DNA-binding CsgD family transcriptional regulator